MSESLFNKVAGLKVFSCEYCKIFKNNYFENQPGTAASEYSSANIVRKECEAEYKV